MENKIITCTVCPRGCEIAIQTNEKNEIIQISGYSCNKGKEYATNEIVAPRRVLTTTMRTNMGNLISVKTDKPALKKDIFDLMKIINNYQCNDNLNMGEIVIKNIIEDINIIVTKNNSN